MRNPARLLLGNPVVLKELRGRMRGPRAFIVLSGFLALVSGFTLLLYTSQSAVSNLNATRVDGGEIGRALFGGVVAIELFLVTFIAPAFTAGAISGERERQTYDLLKTTLLPEGQFVMGKLFSALAYIFLLLLSAIPLQSLSFILGGTDVPDMVISILVLFTMAILLGTIGIYFSARIKRTLSASIMTYGFALASVVGTGIFAVIFYAITSEMLDNGVENSTEWAILIARGVLVCINPVMTLLVTRDYLVAEQTPWTFEYTFQSGNTTTLPSPWLIFMAVNLLVSAVLFWLTTRQIKRVDEF